MFKEIELVNFQNHSRSVLELHPGVNIIAGPSHNGKSSIVRGIRWAITSKPRGDSFRKFNSSKTSVKLTTAEGTVTRIRGDKANEYVLDCDEINDTYKALQQGVPEDIANFLNVAECCIQEQFKPYFLLDISPGDAAKKLNEVSNLAIIDNKLKKVNSLESDCKTKLLRNQVELEDTEEKLKSFEDIDYLLDIFSRTEKMYDRLKAVHTQNTQLTELLEKFEHVQEQLDDLPDVPKLDQPMKELAKMAANEVDRLLVISQLAKDLDILEFLMEEFKNLPSQAELEKQTASLKSITTQKTDLTNHDKKVSSLMALIEQVEVLENQLTEAQKQTLDAQKQLDDLMESLDICPLCGQTLGDDHD